MNERFAPSMRFGVRIGSISVGYEVWWWICQR
jgi:hypothetical protein